MTWSTKRIRFAIRVMANRTHVSMKGLEAGVMWYQNAMPSMTDRPTDDEWLAMRDCVHHLSEFLQAAERLERTIDDEEKNT